MKQNGPCGKAEETRIRQSADFGGFACLPERNHVL